MGSHRRRVLGGWAVSVALVALAARSIGSAGPDYPGKEWPAPGGDWASTRYSALSQINRTNRCAMKHSTEEAIKKGSIPISSRRVMALAALRSDTRPWQVSFKGALQTFQAFRAAGLLADASAETLSLLLTAIASHRVSNRPDRVEPRVVKRRPKPYKHLRAPRRLAQSRLLKNA